MVGHTADLAATEQAIVAIDRALGRIAMSARDANACLVITADHGNAEDMAERDESGNPVLRPNGSVAMKTSHSLNPVEFLLVNYDKRTITFRDDLPNAGLANVASSLIELLGFLAPSEYEPSLLNWN